MASLPIVTLCRRDAASGRSRTNVQWQREIHVYPSKPGSYWLELSRNKGSGGLAGTRQTEVEIHAASTPRPRSHTRAQWHWEIHVNPGNAESPQRHSSMTKGISLGVKLSRSISPRKDRLKAD
jgi:hypothetical protein